MDSTPLALQNRHNSTIGAEKVSNLAAALAIAVE